MADNEVTITNPAALTPETSAALNFSAQIQEVTDSLKSRTAAKKKLTDDWKEIVKAFAKYDVFLHARRGTPERAYEQLGSVAILKKIDPADAVIAEFVRVNDNAAYRIREVTERHAAMKWLEVKLPGISELFEKIGDEYENRGNRETRDEEKTQAARAEVRATIDQLVADLEALEATEDVLNDVDKYINTVEKIANISAVARGRQV